MDAHQLIKAGKLADAISVLEHQVSQHPSDWHAQTFLFELICFSGDFERAEQHLDIVRREGIRESEAGIARYKAVIKAERERQRLFLQRSHPPRLVNGGSAGFLGTVNGQPFLSFSDADPRIGDHLEIFDDGSYFWISLADVRRLVMPPPHRLRDLLWLPVELELSPSLQAKTELKDPWVPLMVPLTWLHPDEEVRLGRVSEWRVDQFGDFMPFGLKSYLADGKEVPLAEIRELTIWPAGPLAAA